jgi:hypothetical protein
VSGRGYSWYLGAFGALVVAGGCIGLAIKDLFASLTPMYVSLVFSVTAIVLAIVAWRRHPRDDAG